MAEKNGRLEKMKERNEEKAANLYDFRDFQRNV
jgi:phosphoserine aminotransferase